MKYIALTIGPIYKTLKNSKKTRELWGGSYIFSYIMKKIIEKFKDRKFITPYVDNTVFESGKEVGLFHDRFIFESTNDTKESVQKVIDEVLKELSNNTPLSFEFLKAYLQINHLEIELDDSKNPILEITPYLDSLEQFYTIGHYKDNELSNMLKNNNSFLIKDAFGTKRKDFPSLPELALRDFQELWQKEEDEAFKDKRLKPCHKYIAIVHADGDSMSEVIKDATKLSQTSKDLFDFCIASHEKIKAFGGQTIFAGGDDLLFFAPVVSSGKTIFELLDEISKSFNDKFNPKATLSFGASITYYKHPLYEALENSRNLLFAKAKEMPKNNIAFEVIKHSGQTFGGVIHKGSNSYEKFLSFVSIEKSLDDNFLHSLHHKIDLHKITFESIKTDKNKLENFFKNYFNEAGHEAYREFFAKLIEYMISEQNLQNIYATLRFIKFIKGDKQ